MIINHNISALNTYRQLTINNNAAAKSLEKLSSGLRINRAGDDAAGLAISEKMRGQIRGLQMAQKNAQDGISLIQTAEGALHETHAILQRMRELAVQAASDTNENKVDRPAIQDEINMLIEELDGITQRTEFNTQKLLDGSFEGLFQIGANENQNIKVSIDKMDAAALGLTKTVIADTGVTATGLKDGSYKVVEVEVEVGENNKEKKLLLLDARENIVGTVSTTSKNVITLADGSTIEFSAVKEVSSGAIITVKDGKAELRLQANEEKGITKLAAGKYEISGSKVLKDGFEVGTFSNSDKSVTINLADGEDVTFTAEDLGLKGDFGEVNEFTIAGIDLSNRDQASASITVLDSAIQKVSTQRSKLGAIQNRLEHTINNLGTAAENLTAAESRIRDVDMAKEMMEFTKNNILQQAAQAMLAQANMQPQGVLQLLR